MRGRQPEPRQSIGVTVRGRKLHQGCVGFCVTRGRSEGPRMGVLRRDVVGYVLGGMKAELVEELKELMW